MVHRARVRKAVPNISSSTVRKRVRRAQKQLPPIDEAPKETSSDAPQQGDEDAERTLKEVILDFRSGTQSRTAIARRKKLNKEKLERKRKQQIEEETGGSEVGEVEATEEDEMLRVAEELGEGEDEPEAVQSNLAPQVRVVNGMIVLDQDSLTFATDKPQMEALDVVEESNVHVTSGTYSKRSKPTKWTEESTDRFYEALSKYGTDFSIIAHLFTDRTRRHIRNKFKLEERSNPARIDAALTVRKPIDLADFDLNEKMVEDHMMQKRQEKEAASDHISSDIGGRSVIGTNTSTDGVAADVLSSD